MPSYPLSAVIKRRSVSHDGYGGDVVTWGTVNAAYACRIYSATAGYRRDVPGEYSNSSHKLMGGVFEIHEGDEIEVGTSRYTVLGPSYPENQVYGASSAHHVEVYLRAHPA
jgi:hypothetical protein